MRQRFVSIGIAAVLSPFKSGLSTSSAFVTKPQTRTFLSSKYTRTSSSLSILIPVQGALLLHHTLSQFPSVSACQEAKPNNKSGLTSTTQRNMSSSSNDVDDSTMLVDSEYPGTAVTRLRNVRARVAQLTEEDLNGDWEEVVRKKLLWAGGLKDLPNSIPGQGYTGHSFNDYNHVDLTTMNDEVSHNENDGKVKNIAIGNRLGSGITIASLPELGPGGSWSTCANGCHLSPPQDVAHIQFRSRIAFKLVWAPNDNKFDTFVLVDDDGAELARGKPTGRLPSLQDRMMNYRLVTGSKYAKVVDEISSS
jgi:hypothetical protein